MIIRRIDRRVHHARKPSNGGGDTEHDRETAINVNAQKPDGFAICHAGAHNHAECGKLQECKDCADDDCGKAKVNQTPIGIYDGISLGPEERSKVKRAGKDLRRRCRDWVRAIVVFYDFLQNDCEAECNQDLVGMWAFVEMFDQAALHNEANGDHDWDGEQYRQRDRPINQHISSLLPKNIINMRYFSFGRVS